MIMLALMMMIWSGDSDDDDAAPPAIYYILSALPVKPHRRSACPLFHRLNAFAGAIFPFSSPFWQLKC
jgi:hypothetical protein